MTNMRLRRRMGAVGWASRGSPHGADVHARSIRGMSGTGGAEAVEKSLGLRPPRVIFRCVRFSATGKGPLRGGSAPGNLSGEERSNDMNGLLKSLPAWLVGVYLATGLMDGTWNPLDWNGQQWAAAVLAGVIVLIGSWAWNRWKAKRG